MRTLILGSTGFVGQSLLLNPPAEIKSIVGASRSRHLGDSNGQTVMCDVQVPIELEPDFDLIIHAATSSSASLNATDPLSMFNSIVIGMTNVIDFCSRHKKPPRLVFTSSGGVYGEMPKSIDKFPEGWYGAAPTNNIHSAYAEGKRVAELLLTEGTLREACIGITARLFSFSGPLLPKNRHFAIENFVRNAVHDRKIVIRGDGSSVRSYLDQSDLCAWLWKISMHGIPMFPYHIGSEHPITIRELAEKVAHLNYSRHGIHTNINILNATSSLDGVNRYVPSTQLTRKELDLEEKIDLDQSIDSMLSSVLIDFRRKYL